MTSPDGSEAWVDPIFDAVVSNVQLTGYFDIVNEFAPTRPPGTGINASVWIQGIEPVPTGSGLASTSAVLLFMVRLWRDVVAKPLQGMDREVTKAASNVIRQYHDDFDFGLTSIVRNVDLLGITGYKLSGTAGYVEQDKNMYRVFDILVPVICNDVWQQIP